MGSCCKRPFEVIIFIDVPGVKRLQLNLRYSHWHYLWLDAFVASWYRKSTLMSTCNGKLLETVTIRCFCSKLASPLMSTCDGKLLQKALWSYAFSRWSCRQKPANHSKLFSLTVMTGCICSMLTSQVIINVDLRQEASGNSYNPMPLQQAGIANRH